jgi:hypothetical protein
VVRRQYHLRNPDNVVIAAAYEAYQGFPSVLAKNAYAFELGCLPLKIGVIS